MLARRLVAHEFGVAAGYCPAKQTDVPWEYRTPVSVSSEVVSLAGDMRLPVLGAVHDEPIERYP